MILAKKTDNGLVYIAETNQIESRDAYMILDNLDEGQYIIFVSMDWKNFPEADRFFNVTSYGAGENDFGYVGQNKDGSLKFKMTRNFEHYDIQQNLLKHVD